MDHINPQKSLCLFLLREGGGKWLAGKSGGPVVPLMLAMCQMADAHNVVECSQADVADCLGYSIATVKRCMKFLMDFEVIRRVRRGVYVLISYESLKQKYHGDTFGGEKYHGDTLKTVKYHSDTFGSSEASKSAGDTYIKELTAKAVSSARTHTRATAVEIKQQKIAKLEEIISRNIGPNVWSQSTSWHELLDRADWDLEVIADAVVAYADKVTGAGHDHRFSRLYNFVVRQVEGKRKREAGTTSPPSYSRNIQDTGGERLTEIEMQELRRFMRV